MGASHSNPSDDKNAKIKEKLEIHRDKQQQEVGNAQRTQRDTGKKMLDKARRAAQLKGHGPNPLGESSDPKVMAKAMAKKLKETNEEAVKEIAVKGEAVEKATVEPLKTVDGGKEEIKNKLRDKKLQMKKDEAKRLAIVDNINEKMIKDAEIEARTIQPFEIGDDPDKLREEKEKKRKKMEGQVLDVMVGGRRRKRTRRRKKKSKKKSKKKKSKKRRKRKRKRTKKKRRRRKSRK